MTNFALKFFISLVIHINCKILFASFNTEEINKKPIFYTKRFLWINLIENRAIKRILKQIERDF